MRWEGWVYSHTTHLIGKRLQSSQPPTQQMENKKKKRITSRLSFLAVRRGLERQRRRADTRKRRAKARAIDITSSAQPIISEQWPTHNGTRWKGGAKVASRSEEHMRWEGWVYSHTTHLIGERLQSSQPPTQQMENKKRITSRLSFLAVRRGLEPLTPCVTGTYSNQLN